MKVLVFGTFDHFHPGHHFVLSEAAKRGDLSVVIARDANVQKIKGKRPQESEEIRKKSIQDAFPDAHIFLGDEKDFLVPVRSVKPDLILLGYDQRLPPGVTESDLEASIERLPAFEPQKYKSSLRRSA
ncbi:MAG TPA: adenylyltransferase/cytidyltransferase family protein [Candidatus Peribacteraceae bacterium]|nr:adenylyltransferase/cytidyltransferase family protein [Candidatus Peribacteraceae bacterium]